MIALWNGQAVFLGSNMWSPDDYLLRPTHSSSTAALPRFRCVILSKQLHLCFLSYKTDKILSAKTLSNKVAVCLAYGGHSVSGLLSITARKENSVFLSHSPKLTGVPSAPKGAFL